MSKSIIEQPEGSCFLCGCIYKDWSEKRGLHKHHIFYGIANRRKSEKYGLTIKICSKHHTGDIYGKDEAIHFNRDIDEMVKQFAQVIFEKEHSHELFVKEFGRSWL